MKENHLKRDVPAFPWVPMTAKERQILKKTAAYVKKAMSGEGSGHDWWHVARVAQNAALISKGEPKANPFVVGAAALLHDIKDWKFSGGDEEAGPREAARLLKKLGADPESVSHIAQIMREVTYKGAGVKTKPSSLEGKIVQDADRLDALGAIGIARCFAYGGMRGREIYNPEEKPILHKSFAQYKKAKGHSVNHFYEKLLLLTSRMNTKTGRRLAKARDRFMRNYLKNFFAEWKGRA